SVVVGGSKDFRGAAAAKHEHGGNDKHGEAEPSAVRPFVGVTRVSLSSSRHGIPGPAWSWALVRLLRYIATLRLPVRVSLGRLRYSLHLFQAPKCRTDFIASKSD